MLKRIIIITLISIVVSAQAYASVTDVVKKSVDEVVRIVSDKEMKKNPLKRRQALKQAIDAIFDYTEMSKRSLGRNWDGRTPAERKQFVALFETLLENSYADKIESYDNEKIEYLNETEDGNYAEVRSRILTHSHDYFSLDYRLMDENGSWKVYDVLIEGVSLVSNYRSQFNKIISENGYSELLKKMQTKSKEIQAR
ncbi:MAG: ABC transporter substrate-binding protein [Geobacteraceae bacterium]|nr:ABC transporter substrate-binding protein [Geobacteraceae bacterium]